MPTTRKLLFAAIVLITAACGSDDAGDDDGLTVIATTTVLGDVVSRVVGGDARVETLMPVGIDPHDFRASAAQVAAINRADLVVANGLLLEEGMEAVLAAAADDGVTILEIAPLVDPIPFGTETDGASYDPHVWFDPLRMAEAGRLVAAALADLDTSADWSGRAEAYADDLTAADTAIVATLATIPADQRRLVTNHDSLGYFADRYDFDVVGVVIPGGSTLGDPSSQELADLVGTMAEQRVSVIFGETTQPSAVADAVAAELGEAVEVVSLHTGSLGEPGSGADTLIGMLRTNAERIAEGLGE